ncbi:hypothetical protein MMC21_006501 [Puttea exsequens]|nr:hypothetical protein [Puttea exsequens]
MARDRDRAPNPAAAQRKSDKAKALKKGKAAIAAQRTQRYAARNPRRLEAAIAELQALKESQGGKLGARDEKVLGEREEELRRVRRAREVVGVPPVGQGGRGRGGGEGQEGRGREGGYKGLGKRRWDGVVEEEGRSSGSETDEAVRRIPWPKDTPPPIPAPRPRPRQDQDHPWESSTNANSEPLGAERRIPERAAAVLPDTTLPAKPTPSVATVKTTYESAPQVRDLRKEATRRFVPSVVKRKIEAGKGRGKLLLEEEEVEALEREGYGEGSGRSAPAVAVGDEAGGGGEGGDEGEGERFRRRLDGEEERFRREMEMEMKMEVGEDGEVEGNGGGPKGVVVEEVSDEDL